MFLQLAHSYSPDVDVRGWLLSRKLNGFAAVWDGGITRGLPAEQVSWYVKGGDARYRQPVVSTGLWSRNGKVISAPDWWLDKLPVGVPIQGEIWWNDQKSIAAVCNCKDKSDDRWHRVKFMVYNYKPYCSWGVTALDSEFSPNLPLKQRLAKLQFLTRTTFSEIGELLPQREIVSLDHLAITMQSAMSGGWEGIMLANPDGYYRCTRSRDLLKVKPSYDIEATVIGYVNGQGRHVGRLGSVVVELTWDEKVLTFHGGNTSMIGKKVQFNVGGGLSDEQREWDFVRERLPIGSTITVKFTEVGIHGAPPSGSISWE